MFQSLSLRVHRIFKGRDYLEGDKRVEVIAMGPIQVRKPSIFSLIRQDNTKNDIACIFG